MCCSDSGLLSGMLPIRCRAFSCSAELGSAVLLLYSWVAVAIFIPSLQTSFPVEMRSGLAGGKSSSAPFLGQIKILQQFFLIFKSHQVTCNPFAALGANFTWFSALTWLFDFSAILVFLWVFCLCSVSCEYNQSLSFLFFKACIESASVHCATVLAKELK